MRPKKHETTMSGDLFRARLDIIKLKHELVQLAGKIDWDTIDGEIAGRAPDDGVADRSKGCERGRCLIAR